MFINSMASSFSSDSKGWHKACFFVFYYMNSTLTSNPQVYGIISASPLFKVAFPSEVIKSDNTNISDAPKPKPDFEPIVNPVDAFLELR